ncbi:hypothetical protein K440DRAFT_609511 [Wilcoxina mikolae CBS 423.85]|nr:hypothetical protein K440DRAFT_609511 [Wilcoxina mikolae CBS 423.85]
MLPILQDRSLRRKVIEGMVGYKISALEARQNAAEIDGFRDLILRIVLKFANLRSGTTEEVVRASLNEIFQTRNRIQQAFRTQGPDITFVISNPRANPEGATPFNALTMEAVDQEAPRDQRAVMILMFPGVFKISGVRTCIVKAKVLCVSD